MDSYLEIRILPDPEFVPALLMNAFYGKLHRVLVKLGSTEIGVSFPSYDAGKPELGMRIRLHSSHERLQALMSTHWLTGMHDHVRVGAINQVPSCIQGYAVFGRVQSQSSAERIRRRQMRRHNLTYEKAYELVPDGIERRLALPFVSIKSQSTQQAFRLFIKREEVLKPTPGEFNAYGLSKAATVPLF